MNDAKIRKAIAALRDAAEQIDSDRLFGGCGLCVRVHVVLRLLGASDGHRHHAERSGLCRRVEVRVPRTREDRRGRPRKFRGRVYWPLADAQAFARRRLDPHQSTWSERDLTRLRAMVGRLSLTDMAGRLGRTPRAVRGRIQAEGGVRQILRDHEQLVTTGALARLTRHTKSRMGQWIAMGMPVAMRLVNLQGQRGDHMLHLSAVRAWLADQPGILIHIDPAVRRLLRLTPADVTALQREGVAA